MKRLLIIEDNFEDEDLILRAIKRRNLILDVTIARDGQEACELLGFSSEVPGIEAPYAILLDLKLPKISGHEVMERIHLSERTKHLPILILSSSDDFPDVQRTAAFGVKHLRKPYDFYEFLDTVGDAIQELCSEDTA